MNIEVTHTNATGATQRRVQIGLNKGKFHHALKNALRIGRQGEIRDRSTEGQHYRMAGLNLLAATVICWNTARLGEAVAKRRQAGQPVVPELLPHISPLGWAHILFPGEYRWQKNVGLSLKRDISPFSATGPTLPTRQRRRPGTTP